MANLSHIVSLKVSLISVAVLSLAITLNLYLSLLSEFLLSDLPVLWVSLRSWLTPPYLYVIINFIIITIVASSRFHYKVDELVLEEPVKIQADYVLVPEYMPVVELKSPVHVQTEVVMMNTETDQVYQDEEASIVVVDKEEAEIVMVDNEEEAKIVMVDSKEEDELVNSSSLDEIPSRTASMEIPMEYAFSKEKPPVSARFGHRKIAKTNQEGGKSLKVIKPKRQDTFENTWKMITEGRPMPLARHLKKSDTWETHHSHSEPAPPEEMKKSESFSNHSDVSTALTRSQGSGKLKKEPSLSQDDLNRRVEAFINKFNEEMRLQRLESLNRYKEMMNHGAQF